MNLLKALSRWRQTWMQMTTPSFSHDAQLKALMQPVGLATWQALRQKARLSRSQLRDLRQGHAERLPVAVMERVAQALGRPWWDLLPRLSAVPLAVPGVELQEFRYGVLEKLKPALVQYPTLEKVVQRRSNYPAQQVLALFVSLANLLADWGVTPIGQVWEAVPFDPDLHQPDEAGIQPGETVYIRFVGYCCGEQVWLRAKVSRTLPALAHDDAGH